ncbi:MULTISPECIES: hypothetical protein [unclassified Sphingopyxis]|uniref:hypothetical protein n=1 Tax=unclassified Sphingopyxis TaxID=2614943 RepID=UPI000ACD98CE|nr:MULTISPECIES: hypothetical protein [unclassified Sphingopyxis]
MKSIDSLGMQPASLPLAADNILEFHAARLLLLMEICGTAGRIDGLTKMAKLDFFTRYPDFFAVARASLPASSEPAAAPNLKAVQPPAGAVEASMVRHHYGPWDKRYYHVLAHLEARELITVSKEGRSYRLALTSLGKSKAKLLAAKPSFEPLVARLREVKSVFGRKSGTYLKDLIYRLFDEEVGRREMGGVIHT